MTEAAGCNVTHPAQILHDQRVAQTQFRHVAGTFRGREFGIPFRPEQRDQRIARQNAHHHEDDDGHAEHCQQSERCVPAM